MARFMTTYKVTVTFELEVLVDTRFDPNTDPEFDKAVYLTLKEQMTSAEAISDNIINWEELE
jgi:hypothetical protein